jgi:hypothetical protein
VATIAALVIAVTNGTAGRNRRSVPAGPTPSTASSMEAWVLANGRHCITDTTPRFDTFTIDPVPGVGTTMVTPTTCAGLRNRILYASGGATLGDVTLYAPGVFDQSVLAGATTVSGHGITGYVLDLPKDSAATFCPLDTRYSPPGLSGGSYVGVAIPVGCLGRHV